MRVESPQREQEVRPKGPVMLIFPGQGKRLLPNPDLAILHSRAANEIFDLGSEVLGTSMQDLLRHGNEADLNQPSLYQPLQVAMNLGTWAFVQEQQPVLRENTGSIGGHSLGEVSAAVAAKCIDVKTGITLAHIRGRATEELAAPGGMMALVGDKEQLTPETLQPVLERLGDLDWANYNMPGQIVISAAMHMWEKKDELMARLYKELPAIRRIFPLETGAGYHSRFVAGVHEVVAEHVAPLRFDDPTVPIYRNRDNMPTLSGELVKQGIIDQTVRRINFVEYIKQLNLDGIRYMIEPSQFPTIYSFFKSADSAISTLPIRSLADLGPQNVKLHQLLEELQRRFSQLHPAHP